MTLSAKVLTIFFVPCTKVTVAQMVRAVSATMAGVGILQAR